MASYGPVAMVTTPWGNAGTLRDRKLQPGRRLPAEEVARNQQERLFAALVAVVAEKGYEATRVEDLLELLRGLAQRLLRALQGQGRVSAGGPARLRRADGRRDLR